MRCMFASISVHPYRTPVIFEWWCLQGKKKAHHLQAGVLHGWTHLNNCFFATNFKPFLGSSKIPGSAAAHPLIFPRGCCRTPNRPAPPVNSQGPGEELVCGKEVGVDPRILAVYLYHCLRLGDVYLLKQCIIFLNEMLCNSSHLLFRRYMISM